MFASLKSFLDAAPTIGQTIIMSTAMSSFTDNFYLVCVCCLFRHNFLFGLAKKNIYFIKIDSEQGFLGML